VFETKLKAKLADESVTLRGRRRRRRRRKRRTKEEEEELRNVYSVARGISVLLYEYKVVL
jgi:hypothetical protein